LSEPLIPVNDLTRGWIAQSKEVQRVTEKVLRSGWYIQGPEHAAFEREFAATVGVQHAVAVASGTDALAIALQSVGCGPGSEVITVANAGGYAAIAALQIGCRLVYADVDPRTLLASRATLETLIHDRIGAVVVTHLYGDLCDVPSIVDLCRKRNIPVVEDCAQAIGGALEGRRVGSLGTVGAFSFYPTKNLGAAGDAGAITTDDGTIADRARRLRQYGWDAKYEVAADGGRNSRLDELQAAVLRIRLPHVDAGNARRRAIIARYAEAASATDVALLPASGAGHAGHLAVALAGDRDAVRAALAAEGVQTDIHYPVPDHRQRPFVDEYRGVALPNTEWAQERIFSLPCFPELTEAEIERVCGVLRGV